ncbi:MAG: hypothetical protein JXR37_36890 [Kiritimatiellae bacterium]|nr:hypothetical protein [Kiritimatiellia bacterium]
MKRRLAPSIGLLDPEFLRAAEASREQVKDSRTRPFPQWARAEIYRHYLTEIRKHSKTVPVSLSTESWSMWRGMGKLLDCTATNYVCGCGPQATPGVKRLTCHPFRVAVANSAGIPGVA